MAVVSGSHLLRSCCKCWAPERAFQVLTFLEKSVTNWPGLCDQTEGRCPKAAIFQWRSWDEGCPERTLHGSSAVFTCAAQCLPIQLSSCFYNLIHAFRESLDAFYYPEYIWHSLTHNSAFFPRDMNTYVSTMFADRCSQEFYSWWFKHGNVWIQITRGHQATRRAYKWRNIAQW